MFVWEDTFIYNQFKMTELNWQDLNTMPLDELEKMVSGIPTSQMDTENPTPEEKEEPQKVEEQPAEPKEEENQSAPTEDVTQTSDKEKKTPESIKKLLHQRSELRQDNDRLRAELDEAKELVRKLRAWELDSEFKNSDGEVDLEKKEEAIQDASFNSKMIEREYNNSNRTIDNTRESELAKFLLDNPDLNDIKEDIVEYANKHKDLDFEDVKYLVLSKVDPTRLLDEQTKNKLSGNYSIPWKSYDWKAETKPKEYKDMTTDELQKLVEEKGLL